MATSTLRKTAYLMTITMTGTTNAQGAVLLDAEPTTDTVLWVHTTSTTAAMGIPFRYGNAAGYWYAKMVDWKNFSVIGNRNFSLEVCILRKPS